MVFFNFFHSDIADIGLRIRFKESGVKLRRAPTAGVPPGGASTARPTRSAGSGPCGRHLALPLPVPARAPLLPGWGSRLVRRCFQALLSTVGLPLPVFPRVPFLACDLACLVCPVQI